MFIKILNVEKTETTKHVITHISIRVAEIILNIGAKIITELHGGGRALYIYEDWLTDDNYKKWGSDDSYIVRWVCEKYGFHQLPII